MVQQASPASSKIRTPPIADRDPDEGQWTPRYIADVKYRRKRDNASKLDNEPPLIPPSPSYWNSPASGHGSVDLSLRAGPESQRSKPEFAGGHGQAISKDPVASTSWNPIMTEVASADFYPRQENDPRSPMSSRMEMDAGSEELSATLLRGSLLFKGSTVVPEIRVEDPPQRPSLMEPRRVRFPLGLPEFLTPSPRPIVPRLIGPHRTIGTPSVRPLSTSASHFIPSNSPFTPIVPPFPFPKPTGSSDSSERTHTFRTGSSVPHTADTPWATPMGPAAFASPWKNLRRDANTTPTLSVHNAGTPLISTQQPEQPSSYTHSASQVGSAHIPQS